MTEFTRLKQQESEQHHRAEELRTRAEQMEAEVFRRAQEIQAVNRQLRQANEGLTELYEKTQEHDRRKNEFLALLGHELRNPLAPLPHAIEVIQEFGPVDPNLQWATDLIDRQVRFMTRMVDDLLDVSRITSGKIILQKEQVELALVVVRAIEATRPLIDSRQHQLHVALPTDPLVVEADPIRLQQVVMNLLNNAAKYTDKGGKIWLSAAKEGKEVVLRVQDTGTGIADEMLPKIFDLFTQESRSLDRAQGGLGIGLTLVRKLIEMHGGSIQAFSDGKGQGSVFCVRLPLLVGKKRAREVRPETEPSLPVSPPRRILFADDNEDFVEVLARLLRKKGGHDVKIAYDGPSALELAQSFQPEVVFLDIGLPQMDGYEVARRLRELPGFGQVLLVALTGYGQEDDRRRAIQAGFDDHLTKPVRSGSLEKLLASAPCPRLTQRHDSKRSRGRPTMKNGISSRLRISQHSAALGSGTPLDQR